MAYQGKNIKIDISPFKHLYPFKSKYMERNGLKYHFLDEGKGEPVIMVHGNPTWSFYFRELITKLSPEYRTIAVDHIGCGLSDKPDPNAYDYRLKSRVDDLEAFIDFLDLKGSITLVLHDWGGMIGTIYALRNIEKIGRIVILNTAGFFPPKGKKIPWRLWITKNISPFATPGVLWFNMFARAALYMAPFTKLSKEVKKGLLAPYNCPQNRLATLKFVQDIPLSKKDPSYDLVKYADENLYRFSDIPMLICWGEHDFVFDKTYLKEWKTRFPHAKVHEFSDAGHYILEDIPDKVTSLVKDFLKTNPAS